MRPMKKLILCVGIDKGFGGKLHFPHDLPVSQKTKDLIEWIREIWYFVSKQEKEEIRRMVFHNSKWVLEFGVLGVP